MKLGYVIANDNAEYIAGLAVSDAPVSSPDCYLWTTDPSLAVIGPKRMIRSLVRMMRYPEPLWVLQLFETERHIFVGTQARNRPAWLSDTLPLGVGLDKSPCGQEVRMPAG